MADTAKRHGFTVRHLPKIPATATITVMVKMHWTLRFRLWLAMRLIWLTGWVVNWQMSVEMIEEEAAP